MGESATQSLKKNLVVVIAGPTASGKSDVAARVCARGNGIIVSADSVQAYRGVQIGANKPTPTEREETPHILVDVADHTENYNAAEWRNDAITAIQALSNQTDREDPGKPPKQSVLDDVRKALLQKGYSENDRVLPVVCGGTMMYLTWLVQGVPDAMKPTKSAVEKSKSTIEKFQEHNNYVEAVEYVSSFGDAFANRTKQFCQDDWYRLRRTLEIALTVEGKANKHELVQELYSGERQGSLDSLGYDVRCFFLCPDDRMKHTSIIDERCEQMLLKGVVNETADLWLSGKLPEMAEKAIGYRQTLDYLKGTTSQDGERADFNAYLNDFTTATRRYAAGQMKWFRKDDDFMFVPVPLEFEKTSRIDTATDSIWQCCKMSRQEYEKALSAEDGESKRCKNSNEEQGKHMKFYRFHRYILKDGTAELEKVLANAVENRERIQGKKRRLGTS